MKIPNATATLPARDEYDLTGLNFSRGKAVDGEYLADGVPYVPITRAIACCERPKGVAVVYRDLDQALTGQCRAKVRDCGHGQTTKARETEKKRDNQTPKAFTIEAIDSLAMAPVALLHAAYLHGNICSTQPKHIANVRSCQEA